MKAIINTGLGRLNKEVTSINDIFNLLPQKPSVTELNNSGLQFIITATGKVYISSDTPGYCDGENRVHKFI